jgi:hypothetical protein
MHEMDWTPSGKQLPPDFLGDLQPEDVLVDYEGPRSFTARDRSGELLFAHQCGESDDIWRYAIVPFSESRLAELTHGRLDLWSALSQPRLWIVDITVDGSVVSCVSTSLNEIPETCRPHRGVMLYAEHEPLLSLRAIGHHVEMGRANLGVLREQLDSMRTGLRCLAEAALGLPPAKGPPSKQTRGYYDLPALMLAGSVQVSVYPPADPQGKLFDFDDTWSRMASLLEWGLRQLDGNHEDDEAPEINQQTQEAVIKAVYALAPPARGNVKETEISGQLLRPSRLSYRLGRRARFELSQRLRLVHEAPPEWNVVQNEGYITELDLEEGTCLLRDKEGNTIEKLQFVDEITLSDESLFEDVKEAFDSGHRVAIKGIRFTSGKEVTLLSVKETPSQAEQSDEEESD